MDSAPQTMQDAELGDPIAPDAGTNIEGSPLRPHSPGP